MTAEAPDRSAHVALQAVDLLARAYREDSLSLMQMLSAIAMARIRGMAARVFASAFDLRSSPEELHERLPDYRIAEGAEVHYSTGIRQAESLPLEFTPA